MLTFRCATTRRVSRSVPLAGAAFALLVLLSAAASPGAARAQELDSNSCIGIPGSGFSCVNRSGPQGDPFIRIVPPPADAAAQSQARERERRWVSRCRPVIAQDRYGVARYRYARAGCAFGIIGD